MNNCTCGAPLQRVTQGPNSMLNREQFDAARLGDWFCDKCPDDGKSYRYFWNSDFPLATPTPPSPAGGSDTFQRRVQPWMMACFGPAIAADTVERNYRFLEESLELVQATGCTQSEAHQLVDYVFGRAVGEKEQEVGGVMVTLAALCLAQGMDMDACGETELARIWTKVEKIRAKQAAKPKHSPLPEATPPQSSGQTDLSAAIMALRQAIAPDGHKWDLVLDESWRGGWSNAGTAKEVILAQAAMNAMPKIIDALAASHPSAPQAPTQAKWNSRTLVHRLYNEPPDYGLLVEAGAEIQNLRAIIHAAPQASGDAGALPKWIDDAKGKDPFTDDLIAEIIRLRNLAATMPSAAPSRAEDEFAWVVENGKDGDALRYRTFEQGMPAWTPDHMKAIRYARREDAEMAHAEDEDAWRIVEHGWHAYPQGAAPSGDDV